MCGIIGVFAKREAVTPDLLRASVSQLHHRGPDSRGYWTHSNGSIGMGHARLSVIDLDTGEQPLVNEDGTIHAVVNGEFYDFERIREELTKKGHSFRSRSDSEVLIHLYEEEGVQCLERLRGEFAFILWDDRNRLLFAARDRFGIKPLYYSGDGQKLVLASEAKALFAAGVPARWSLDGVHQSICIGVPAEGRSYFENIFQMPPGHFLLLQGGYLHLRRYWDFNHPPAGRASSRPEGELIEEFRERLDDAVRLRMKADVPVAFYLSGGLDSSTVLGMASKYVGSGKKTAFTISFDHASYDESAIARETARFCDADLHSVHVTGDRLASNFANAIWHAEAMFINGHGIAKYLLSQAVRDAGYKVVLTGEGSDEILAGYPNFRSDVLQCQGQALEQLRQISRANSIVRGISMTDGTTETISTYQKHLGYVPMFNQAHLGLMRKFYSVCDEAFLADHAKRDEHFVFLSGLDFRNQILGRQVIDQSMYLWNKSHLPNYILSILGDRMEMAHSIEGRLPFLDHPLVEFAVTLPASLKIRGLTEKYVLKEAAKPFITPTVHARQKHPFFAPPLASSPGDPFFLYAQDVLRARQVDRVPFLDKGKIIGLLDELPSMSPDSRQEWDPLLMLVLSACAIQERLLDSGHPTRQPQEGSTSGRPVNL